MKSVSPKAVYETYVGNHIENLAAHPGLEISPCSDLPELKNLPVWVNQELDEKKPETYTRLFWEIEPMGEYVHYLAGDFKKNEKGLLRFNTPQSSFIVETNFEDDVLDVAKSDGAEEQNAAESSSDGAESVLKLTIGELGKMVSRSSHQFDSRVAFVPFTAELSGKKKGVARLVVHKPFSGESMYVTLIYEEFRSVASGGEHPRYLKVLAKSSDAEMSIGTLSKHFMSLVSKYAGMPYVYVSGTTRA